MRKLIVANAVSLDGYFEGPGKNVMDLFQYWKVDPTDDGFSQYNAERLRAASTLLLGRASYRGFADYWPKVADDPKQPAVEREIARLNAAIPKVVISDSLKAEEIGAWHSTTRVVKRGDAHRAVAELKREDGGDILVFGSHVLWNDLLAHGLVDELHLMITPVVLGGGTPAFERTPPGMLRLLETRRREGAATVWLRYRVEA